MIAFVGYILAVSVLLLAAAIASEPLLRALHLPVRSGWVAAFLGVVIATAVAVWAPPSRPGPVTPTRIATRSRATTVTTRGLDEGPRQTASAPVPTHRDIATPPMLNGPRTARIAAALWLLASIGCLLRLLIGARHVNQLRLSCRTGQLAGEPVLVSPSTGPAVIGVMHHVIVVPAWAQELDADAQRLILAHEREHVRARDPLVLHATRLLVALMPWNAPLWIAWRRLRDAIEMDCDARVLRVQAPSARRYCRLLLEVGERHAAGALPLLALAEPATLLERRIDAMTTTRRLRDWTTLLPAAGALLALAGACFAPRPVVAPGSTPLLQWNAISSVPPANVSMTPPAGLSTTPLPGLSMVAPAGVSMSPLAGTSTVPVPDLPDAVAASATAADTSFPNAEAMRRSAMDHQARVDAIADSVIREFYPELTRGHGGTTPFLALVLDDRDRLMRHKLAPDATKLPNDLAAIMLEMGIDTISARTLGVGISAQNRWGVRVGHAVEALGPVRGKTEMRAWMSTEEAQSFRRVPYERIVDSVARARSPEAYTPHDGVYAIAVQLEEDGRVASYAAEPRSRAFKAWDPPQPYGKSRPLQVEAGGLPWNSLMKRMLGDEARSVFPSGMMSILHPAQVAIVWGVRR